MRKHHKIIQKRGVSFGKYLQMKVKGLPKVDGPRTSHILLDIVFPIDIMSLAKTYTCTNENRY